MCCRCLVLPMCTNAEMYDLLPVCGFQWDPVLRNTTCRQCLGLELCAAVRRCTICWQYFGVDMELDLLTVSEMERLGLWLGD